MIKTFEPREAGRLIAISDEKKVELLQLSINIIQTRGVIERHPGPNCMRGPEALKYASSRI